MNPVREIAVGQHHKVARCVTWGGREGWSRNVTKSKVSTEDCKTKNVSDLTSCTQK